MNTQRPLIGLAFVVLCLVATNSGASDLSWTLGSAGPAQWLISPAQPQDIDVIHFSGPLRVYLNRFLAEADLGGRPAISIDTIKKTVELEFAPPATSDNPGMVEPVCGIEGIFGPLSAGQWRFFCSKTGIMFSLTFQVTTQTRKGRIYYVDASATATHDGSNWVHAFTNLQDALAVATKGSEIRVAAGVYHPDRGAGAVEGDCDATFQLGSGITLKGGCAGLKHADPNERNPLLYETVLSGDLEDNDATIARLYDLADDYRRWDNSFHVVTTSYTDSTAVLDGFTIKGGGRFTSASSDESNSGAGIYNCGGQAVIRNCRIANNAAPSFGGGLYNCGAGQPTVIGCTFSNNWAGSVGGAIFSNVGGNIVIDRCIISGNGAIDCGGGVAARGAGQLTISNGIIAGNVASDRSSGRGGGFCFFQATVDIDFCTIADNRAATGPALACDTWGTTGASDVRIEDSIIWNGANSIYNNDRSFLSVTYTDVQGGYSGKGNLAADPRFVKPGSWNSSGTSSNVRDDVWVNGDYHLSTGSPCIDAGDPGESPPADALDLDGNPRLSGAAVDMGAYEFAGSPPSKNSQPVAKANATVTGVGPNGKTGQVTLDASNSFDPEGSPLTYRWYQDSKLISTAVRFTVQLPLGDYVFTLVVNDGSLDSLPVQVAVHVAPFISTSLDFIPNPISRSGPDDPITAVLSLPSGTQPADFDQTQPLVFVPGYLQAKTQAAQIWLNGTPLVIATFDKAEVLKAIPTNGSTQVQVVGRLKNGLSFGGTQTLTITN